MKITHRGLVRTVEPRHFTFTTKFDYTSRNTDWLYSLMDIFKAVMATHYTKVAITGALIHFLSI